nr:hypothetical protein [Tanacetum cinerariifolium]
MPPKRNRYFNDIYEQELEQRIIARMDERFDQIVDQLADRMNDMMNQRRRGNRNGQRSEEEVFEFKEVSENKRYTTEFYQLITRNDIQETDDQLVSRYIDGLSVQIMDYVNMFDPVTLSDAYQRALAFEKRNQRVGSSSSPAITGDGFGSSNVASHFVPNQARPGGGSVLKCFNGGEPGGPVFDDDQYKEEVMTGDVGVNLMVRRSCLTPQAVGDDWLKHTIFKSTCTILGKVCIFVADPVSCGNLIAEEAIQKLGLKAENPLMPNKPKELVNKPTGTLLTLSQFEGKLEVGDEVHEVVYDNLVQANSKYKQDADQKRGNDAGPSVEERALLFLEARDHVKKRPCGFAKILSIIGIRLNQRLLEFA